MVYRARLTNHTRQVSGYLTHMKPYHQPETPPAPHLENWWNCFLGTSELDHPDAVQLKIASYIVDRVVHHNCGPGTRSLQNFKYRLRLRGYGPESDIVYRADKISQDNELVASPLRNRKKIANRAKPTTCAPPPLPSGTEGRSRKG